MFYIILSRLSVKIDYTRRNMNIEFLLPVHVLRNGVIVMNRRTFEENIKMVRPSSANVENVWEVRRKFYQLGIDEGRWDNIGIEKVDGII